MNPEVEESTPRIIGRSLAREMAAGRIKADDTEAIMLYACDMVSIATSSFRESLDPFALLVGSVIAYAAKELESMEEEHS